MKKVMLVTPTLAMGGAEIMCENLAYALRDLNIDISVISLYKKETIISKRLESAGIKVLYLNKHPGFDLQMIFKLYNLFKSEKPDVVHSHNTSIQYAMPAAIMCGVKKKIHTIHSIAEQELIKPARLIAGILYRAFGVVPVALNDVVKSTVKDQYGLKDESIPIVYNGIDLGRCIEKKDYSIEGKFKILHIGRFYKAKNHDMLLRAFKIFNKSFPNSVLWLIGEGPEKTHIERLAMELELTNNVEFLGIQDNVYEFLSRSDVFVLPSLYEGMPMTILEAMGTGLPIIATNVGGVPNVIDNYKNGVLIDIDAVQLTEALCKLHQCEETRKLLGANAKSKSSVFSAHEMAKQYARIYGIIEGDYI